MPKRTIELNVWSRATRLRLLNLIVVVILSGSLLPMSRSSLRHPPAGESPAATHTQTHPYFANAIDAGAELMVAATVLPGSPPPSGLIVNLVMFFDV
jgi:hypothetical protein